MCNFATGALRQGGLSYVIFYSGRGVCTGGFTLDATVLNHMLDHRLGWCYDVFEGLCHVHCGTNTRPQPAGQRSLYTIGICRANSAMLDIPVLEIRQTALG